jgi:benzoyl-CoA reductase/2-hydroxyglutaryl-CoA dehydratase subunit BcrC/BadD/HgdB
MKYIGITTTVPVEVLMAAGYTPLDLNNIFVTSEDHEKYIKLAEQDGFPQNYCSWIKGIYGVCIDRGVKEILAVVGGDCSNSIVLSEVLELKGIKVHSFAYPIDRSIVGMKIQLDALMQHFGVNIYDVEKERTKLVALRNKMIVLDKLTYNEGVVSGWENHLYQVCMSDFNLNVQEYNNDIDGFIAIAKKRMPKNYTLRVGYIGVPPITGDIYDFIESNDAKLVYNEVQREFSMPRHLNANTIYEQYIDYTYPYDTFYRSKEILKQVDERKIDAIIHYTQAFCYRSAQHIILKQKLGIPVLHIEGDKSREIDARTQLRVEAFLDMVKDRKLFKENI